MALWPGSSVYPVSREQRAVALRVCRFRGPWVTGRVLRWCWARSIRLWLLGFGWVEGVGDGEGAGDVTRSTRWFRRCFVVVALFVLKRLSMLCMWSCYMLPCFVLCLLFFTHWQSVFCLVGGGGGGVGGLAHKNPLKSRCHWVKVDNSHEVQSEENWYQLSASWQVAYSRSYCNRPLPPPIAELVYLMTWVKFGFFGFVVPW